MRLWFYFGLSVMVLGICGGSQGANAAILCTNQPSPVDPDPAKLRIIAKAEGTCTSPSKVSGDGSVVVGRALDANGQPFAFYWTATEGVKSIDQGASATGVSDDGKIVVGIQGSGGFIARPLDSLNVYIGMPFYGVSRDGQYAVGSRGGFAVRFKEADGTIDYLNGATDPSAAVDANTDGSVVVGTVSDPTGLHAFVWTPLTMMQILQATGSVVSEAFATDGSGDIIVGYTGDNLGSQAVKWAATAPGVYGGATSLGSLGGNYSFATDVAKDGTIIVGYAEVPAGGSSAFRYTDSSGMKDLNSLLQGVGVDMTNVHLTSATGISGNGRFIVGSGIFGDDPNAYQAGYIVLYCEVGCADTPVGGVTTAASVRTSVSQLSDGRTQAMAQQHAVATPLLGGDKAIDNTSEIGIFGQAGSAQGGGYARYAMAGGLSILGGVSYQQENYDQVQVNNALMGAAALRYLMPSEFGWQPFAEAGGWYAPDADLDFQRTYANGGGTATGFGSTSGDVSYYYGRAGVVVGLGRREQVAIFGELGREKLKSGGYAETFGASNPFNAAVSSGTDEMDMAKAGVRWSSVLGGGFDFSAWGVGVYGFNRQSNMLATVSGVGTFAPILSDSAAWAEYGLRVGYAVAPNMTFDVFFNGVSGEEDVVGTRVHGGAGLRYRF